MKNQRVRVLSCLCFQADVHFQTYKPPLMNLAKTTLDQVIPSQPSLTNWQTTLDQHGQDYSQPKPTFAHNPCMASTSDQIRQPKPTFAHNTCMSSQFSNTIPLIDILSLSSELSLFSPTTSNILLWTINLPLIGEPLTTPLNLKCQIPWLAPNCLLPQALYRSMMITKEKLNRENYAS